MTKWASRIAVRIGDSIYRFGLWLEARQSSLTHAERKALRRADQAANWVANWLSTNEKPNRWELFGKEGSTWIDVPRDFDTTYTEDKLTPRRER